VSLNLLAQGGHWACDATVASKSRVLAEEPQFPLNELLAQDHLRAYTAGVQVSFYHIAQHAATFLAAT
jgi:hypothetical protein